MIVGGGATGVEYAGALAELIFGPLLKDFGGIARDEVDIRLLECARVRLERRGVQVLTGSQVVEVASDRVMTRKTDTKTDPDNDPGNAPDTDSTATCTVVWAAGVQGDPAVGAWGLPVGPAGRVPVKSTLRVPGHPEVFAAADLACVEADGQPLPQVAQVALQQGSMTADNVLRMIKGETPGDFAYRDLSMLTVIGRNAAVAHLGGGGHSPASRRGPCGSPFTSPS